LALRHSCMGRESMLRRARVVAKDVGMAVGIVVTKSTSSAAIYAWSGEGASVIVRWDTVSRGPL